MTLKKNYPWNVLVFPAASEIALEIHRALGRSKEVVLHGANQPGESAASFHFHRLHELPPVGNKDCLPHLQRLIASEKIDAIFPAHDDAVLWLAECAGQLKAEIISSDATVAAICRSKRKTYQALVDCLDVPSILDPRSALKFPVFVKPDRGQGSYRARRIDSPKLLDQALAAEPDLLTLEYLPGREYTVDCFSQRGVGVLYAKTRQRVQVKNGISTLTRSVKLPYAREWAERIATRFNLRGAWFFQIKEDAAGRPKLLEVAPRIAGSMALSRITGPNFPLLSLYEAAGFPLMIDAFETDMPMGRSLDVRFIYDRPIAALYIDLDDTILLHGEVDTKLMALVFQCRNRGIPVCLITRHKGDVQTTLKKFRLDQLFDRVVPIMNAETPKADLITEKDAVLIDDSFKERHAASMRGIRCFDAAGAECLLDDRR